MDRKSKKVLDGTRILKKTRIKIICKVSMTKSSVEKKSFYMTALWYAKRIRTYFPAKFRYKSSSHKSD